MLWAVLDSSETYRLSTDFFSFAYDVVVKEVFVFEQTLSDQLIHLNYNKCEASDGGTFYLIYFLGIYVRDRHVIEVYAVICIIVSQTDFCIFVGLFRINPSFVGALYASLQLVLK